MEPVQTAMDFWAPSEEHVAAFNAWAAHANPHAEADHICYKCSSSAEFEHVRALLEPKATFLFQSYISGRRIAIIAFETPIVTVLGDIRVLELSDQKPDGSQEGGFDHIEIYSTEGTVEELVTALEQAGTKFEKVVRPHHTTYDANITRTFKVRLEDEPLLEKIKREEMT